MATELLVNARTEDGTTLARIRGDKNAPTVQISPELLGGEVLTKDSLILMDAKFVFNSTGRYLVPVDAKVLDTKASVVSPLAGQVYTPNGAPHPADVADGADEPPVF